jgi:heme/copper-type cytochrome/quinol oxidase subunit 2
MTARVRVVSPTDYQTWLAQQAQYINSANQQVTQLRQELTASGNL